MRKKLAPKETYSRTPHSRTPQGWKAELGWQAEVETKAMLVLSEAEGTPLR